MLFGEIAIEKGLITHSQLEEALELQRDPQVQGWQIGHILASRGYIETDDIDDICTLQSNWIRFPQRYRYEGKIDEGGMGKIYRLYDTRMEREVACKVSKHASERFYREVHITSRLSHPNIIPIYDQGTTADGWEYYTMKLIRGQSLACILENPENREKSLIKIFLAICRAIEFSHKFGVIHRDLKPANVMVENNEDVMVCDWGLAKFLAKDDECFPLKKSPSSLSLTQDGELMGTLLYASPEQLEGRSNELDAATDIYALGVILYQLATGIHPFAKQLEEITYGAEKKERFKNFLLRSIREQKINRPHNPEKKIIEELEAIALKAIAYRRENRYFSVRDLVTEIENFLNHRPVSVWKDSLRVRLQKWIRRSPVKFAISIACIIIFFLGIYIWYGEQQKRVLASWNQDIETLNNVKRRIERGLQKKEMVMAIIKPYLERNNSFFQREIGKIFFMLGEYERAHKHYESALVNAQNLFDKKMALIYRVELRWAESESPNFIAGEEITGPDIEAYTKAFQLRSQQSHSGNIETREKSLLKLAEAFAEALSFFPEIGMLMYYRGLAYHELMVLLKESDSQRSRFYRSEALKDYSAALQYAPHQIDVYFNRHFLYKVDRRYPEAIDDLNTCLEKAPGRQKYVYYPYKAMLLAQLGRSRETLSLIDEFAKVAFFSREQENAKLLVALYELRQSIFLESPEIFADENQDRENTNNLRYQKARLLYLQGKKQEAKLSLVSLDSAFIARMEKDPLLPEIVSFSGEE